MYPNQLEKQNEFWNLRDKQKQKKKWNLRENSKFDSCFFFDFLNLQKIQKNGIYKKTKMFVCCFFFVSFLFGIYVNIPNLIVKYKIKTNK